MERKHLAHLIRDSAARHAERPAMRYKVDGSWRSISYAEMDKRVRAAARALLELGVRRGDRVGIYAPNQPGWAIADFAILSVGAVSVAIYATETARGLEYIARDAELKLIFVGGREHYDKLQSCRTSLELLETVVVFDDAVAAAEPGALGFSDFLELGQRSVRGAEIDAYLERASGGDVALFIYTSGTTGPPKGVMLSHDNLFLQFSAIDDRFEVGPEDRSVCFLPLSHAFERAWSYYVFRCGAENCYLSDPKRILGVLRKIRPTVMVSVPLLYEKMYAAINAELERSSPGRRRLFAWAVRTGRRYAEARLAGESVAPILAAQHAIADRLVLRRIREVLGGPKNFLASGGAPLSPQIEELIVASGVLLCQGYGLTETAPMITCNAPGAFRFGTVGTPVRDVELRIGEGGEILVRGPNVMKGYHGRPEESEQVFVDGWLRTGDVGELDADGFLRVTDRIKDLIITGSGENVAPQHIELALKIDPYTDEVVAIGDKRKFLSALIVPKFEALEQYAHEHAINFASRAELVRHPDILAFFRERIDKLSEQLPPFERIKAFVLLDHELSHESGELTPTQKVKRDIVQHRYADLIEEIYGSGETRASPG